MPYYKVIEWGEGLYRITSPECVFIELIVGEERALLIDSGWGIGNLKETVRKITGKPLMIVTTHGHLDHINGNYQFENEIYIHQNDILLYKQHSNQDMRQYILESAEGLGILPEGFRKAEFLRNTKNTLKPVQEGYVFELGEKSIEVIELAGHTRGSIGLLYREEGIFYVGDAMNSTLLLHFPESTTLEEYILTLKKAQTIEFSKMVQSHQESIYEKEILELYLDTAKHAEWSKAYPYKEGESENPDVRVICSKGKTMENHMDSDFACIVISKEKLKEN